MNASTATPTAAAGIPIDRTEAIRQIGTLRNWVLGAIVLSCAGMVSLNLVDPDLWGHVRYGQDWLADGTLHRTATHTYTAVGHPWVNHENLAELAMAEGYRVLGVRGLLLAKCAIGLGILASMAWVARRHGVGALMAWVFLWLIARNLQAFFPLRPQLLSFVCCAATLVALDRAFRDWRETLRVDWKPLAAVPFIMAVWVNSHGAFVAGLCIIGALLLGRIVELAIRRPNGYLKTTAVLAAAGLACLAATLCTPYGLELHRWLIASLGQPRPEITEWLPPSMGTPVFWPLVTLCVLAVAAIAGTTEKRDWVQITILALVAYQAWSHLRHIAFFALLCGFWLPVHLRSALVRLRPSGVAMAGLSPGPWLRHTALAALVVSCAMHGWVLAGNLRSFPVPRANYPVDAMQFMADHGLHGRLVVSFNWAQYAIAAFADSGTTVGFDGRFRTCYPQELVDAHFDFLLGDAEGLRNRAASAGQVDGSKVLSLGNPDLVLVDRRYENSVEVMKRQQEAASPEWSLLYRDRISELWGRSSRYDQPQSEHYLAPSDRRQDPTPRTGAVEWPALPVISRPDA